MAVLGTIAPFPKHQFFTDAGIVAAGYKLFTYESGTTTKLATYSESTLTSANTNPIVLDAAGRATIFLTAASYKFVLAPPNDTDPPVSPTWTVDGVSASGAFEANLDLAGVAGSTLTAGECVYLSAGDGGLTAGRWYKTNASNTYSSTTANAIGFVVANATTGGPVSVRTMGTATASGILTSGTIFYISSAPGSITSTAPANARPVGVGVDNTSRLILSQWLRGTEDVSGVKQFLDAVSFDSSAKSSHATAGIGYATGAGGTVTQQTNKTTGVTLDKVCGQITMNNAALGAGVEATFTVTCSAVAATDVVVVCHGSAGTAGAYQVGVSTIAAGSFAVTVTNLSAGSLSEAIVINYAVIKAVGA